MTNTNKHGVDHEELKPCDCGANIVETIEIHRLYNGHEPRTVWMVKCGDCGSNEAFTTPYEARQNEISDAAYLAWNNRTDTQELTSKVPYREAYQRGAASRDGEVDELTVYVRRLRKALVVAHEEAGKEGGVSRLLIEDALDSTPIIFLQQHDNEVIEKVAVKMEGHWSECDDGTMLKMDSLIRALKTGGGDE